MPSGITYRAFFIVATVCMLSACGYMMIARKKTSVQRSLASLNATVITSKNDDATEVITSIRLDPNRNHKGKLRELSTPSLADTLVMFDASDCNDFGDQELQLISHVNSLEYLMLARTSISDASLETIAKNWSNLKFLVIDDCKVSEQAIVALLSKRKLKFIRVSGKFDTEPFQKTLKSVAPESIVMCNGRDLLGHPPEAFEFIRWGDW